MLTYNLIEYNDNYLKTSGSFWQHYRDNTVSSESFQFKINITGKTPADGNTKDVKIAVPVTYGILSSKSRNKRLKCYD